MNATEVRDALERHWKPSEYLVMHECPQDAMRQGRKIDTLVISLWKSRGYELDAIEIKVSHSDWQRELENPDKADWWWWHSHRFWVAAPTKVADKIHLTLPTGWGLLGVGDSGTGVLVKPTKHDANPLPWTAAVGIMRGASGAGANALLRAQQRGIEIGREQVERQAQRDSDTTRYDALNAKVEAFANASGIDPRAEWQLEGARRLGELVKVLRNWTHDPVDAAKAIERSAESLRSHATGLTTVAAELRSQTRGAHVA